MTNDIDNIYDYNPPSYQFWTKGLIFFTRWGGLHFCVSWAGLKYQTPVKL